MAESLYAEHPDVYDALYAGKDYDGETEFVVEQFQAHGNDGNRVLVVGCGTGEHSRRLTDRGFDVTGVDKYEAMVERARTKSDARFAVGSLPDVPVAGPFDLAFLPFTVVNHLPDSALGPSLRAVADVLADGGVLVFDHMSFAEWPEGPQLVVHDRENGTYARLTQVHERDESRHRWDSLVFTPDGRFFADTHELTTYDPARLVGLLESEGLDVTTCSDYDGTPAKDEDAMFVYVAA